MLPCWAPISMKKKTPGRCARREFLSDMMRKGSDDALAHHCVCYLEEASDVGTLHVVDVTVSLCTVLYAVLVDVGHDHMEHLVHFLCAPLEVFGVLSHFKTGNSHTTGVYSPYRERREPWLR